MKVDEKLRDKGLKVTPQRVAIYNAVVSLKNHPTAENVVDVIKKHHPSISVGTVYKVLNVFVEKGLFSKVKSENEVMRYDAIVEKHHHLYCNKTDKIQDFEDPELDKLISDYFSKKNIKGFDIKDVSLQITGEFKKQ